MMHKIYLSYIKVSTFSGQTASTILIKKLLSDKNYEFHDIYLYPFKRGGKNIIFSIFEWLYKTLLTVPNILSLVFTGNPILYINLGQSYFSFFRVLWWYLPLRMVKRNLSVIISLNGHSFVGWDLKNSKTYIFTKLLNSAKIITVVGDIQKSKLIGFGIIQEKLYIIPNTIDNQKVSTEFILNKHLNILSKPVELLFLSLLVESKGYPEYLEALLFLAKSDFDIKINATLCGPITKTSYCTRFYSKNDAQTWINDMINQINGYPHSNITAKWIPGAKGIEKQNLFNSAQIFVLPTYYPNEAQPLVILEALASGCALITSTAGEIPGTVSTREAIILKQITPENIALAITDYIIDEKMRIENVVSGLKLYNEKYSLDIYTQNWVNLFDYCFQDKGVTLH